MTTGEEEKICLFCLETKKGRRQHNPIEFKGLFPCECIFQSHAECIIKWQIHCFDDIQCPICRVHLDVDEEDQAIAIILYHPQPASPAHLKKILYYFFVCVLVILGLFSLVGLRL